MGLKAQMRRFRNGEMVEAHSDQLLQLHDAVQRLTEAVQRLDLQTEATREQLRTITDDLGDRIGSLSARLEAEAGRR